MVNAPEWSNARYLTEEDSRRIAAMFAASVVKIYRRWPTLPLRESERVLAVERLRRARQELAAYNAAVRRALDDTRSDGSA